MKTLSRHFLTVALTLSITSLFGQDIFYTISGEVDNQKVGIDSILFENLDNNTRLLFDNLSEQEDYVINLSSQTFWGATGIDEFKFENGFSLLKNTDGNLSIACNFTSQEVIHISIYNLQGRSLYVSNPLNITEGNSIHINLAKYGVYLVKIESSAGSKTFKARGSDNVNSFSVKLNFQKPLNNNKLKNNLDSYDSDFSFEIRDNLRVSIYKDGYWSNPKTQSISRSISIAYTLMVSVHTGVFSDSRDGQTYRTIEIEDQVWMVGNLKYLPSVIGSSSGSSTIPYYYVWGYNGTDLATAKATENYTTYDVLYNWPAACASCPSGWHLPSDSEWTKLTDYLINNGYGYGGSGDDIGKSMAATFGWNTNSGLGHVGNDLATNNSSGFTALPGGYRSGSGSFYPLVIGGDRALWSSSEDSSSHAWNRYMFSASGYVYRHTAPKEHGFSVRCLKD